MRRHKVRRFVGIILVLSWVLPAGFLSNSAGDCDAQSNVTLPEYDYRPLAIASILSAAQEAAKLPDIEQRVTLLIRAAQVLPASKRDDAIGFLDVALHDLKEWTSDKNKLGRRSEAARLRSQILSAYARLDSAKALALRTAVDPQVDPSSSLTASSLEKSNWLADALDRQRLADESGKLALTLIDTDFEKALALVVHSIGAGIISPSVTSIFLKLEHDRNRLALDRLETAVLPVLTSTITLDPYSLSYAGIAAQSDPEMSATAKRGFVDFFINSLQTWVNLAGDDQNGLDSSYMGRAFSAFTLSVRPVILRYSPDQLLTFDLALNQVAPLVSEKTKSALQAFQPETFSDPRDRLNDILKDPAPEKRDLRLMRLVFELLRSESENFQKRFDLASDAISGFSDPDNKAAFTDLLTITRMSALVKQKKFIEAQQLADSIPSEETRAWALLALSTVAAKADRVLGFELISNALTALDKASPSPHKVELALMAGGMLAKDDPERAFDTLSAASRYANSSASKVDPPTKPAVAFGLEATIGEAHTKLGVFPESLGEVEIDPSLSTLGTTDWFRANQIANDIREPALRLRLKLEFAEAVLANNPKPKVKAVTTKPLIQEELH